MTIFHTIIAFCNYYILKYSMAHSIVMIRGVAENKGFVLKLFRGSKK